MLIAIASTCTFRHFYKSIAKCAGKDYRDGAVVPVADVLCALHDCALGIFPVTSCSGVKRLRYILLRKIY